jgi:hypothetical protein
MEPTELDWEWTGLVVLFGFDCWLFLLIPFLLFDLFVCHELLTRSV